MFGRYSNICTTVAFIRSFALSIRNKKFKLDFPPMFKSHWFPVSKTDWSKFKVLNAFNSCDDGHLLISLKNSCIFLSNAIKTKTSKNIFQNKKKILSIPSPRVNSVLPNSVPKWSKPQLRNQRTRPRTWAVFVFLPIKSKFEIFRVGDFHWMWFWCDFFMSLLFQWLKFDVIW